MHYYEKEGAIPHDAPAKVFLQARVVTLFLDTRKNSIQSKSTTMEATDLEQGNPVSAAAAAWSFLHLRQHNAEPDTTI